MNKAGAKEFGDDAPRHKLSTPYLQVVIGDATASPGTLMYALQIPRAFLLCEGVYERVAIATRMGQGLLGPQKWQKDRFLCSKVTNFIY